jgi:hypothetical protein
MFQLNRETLRAARGLAVKYGCSVSEAIRRAVVAQRDLAFGLPKASRGKRNHTLRRLFRLFAGNDAADEVSRLKAEDSWF